MAVINVGSAAINRAASGAANYTIIDDNVPANGTGLLDTIEVYAKTALVGFKVGTFIPSIPNFTPRSYVLIGDVTSGSKQTFSGLAINVVTGDRIGYVHPSGAVASATSTGKSA